MGYAEAIKEKSVLEAQVWKAYPDGNEIDGYALRERAKEHGWADGWFFQKSEVGTVLKTGVSAYERIR